MYQDLLFGDQQGDQVSTIDIKKNIVLLCFKTCLYISWSFNTITQFMMDIVMI